MTPAELRAIRERCEAATPGPWEPLTVRNVAGVRAPEMRCYVYLNEGRGDTHPDTVKRWHKDVAFIAAARTDVPALLDEVDRLRSIHPSSLTDVLTALEDDRDAAVRERDEARTEAKELREVLTRAGERLKACSYGLTEFSYQEMASVLFDLPCNTEEPTNG